MKEAGDGKDIFSIIIQACTYTAGMGASLVSSRFSFLQAGQPLKNRNPKLAHQICVFVIKINL